MTESQALRMERRAIQKRRRTQRRVQAAKDALAFLLFVGLLLAAFAAAGTLDYQDRTQGLGADMRPASMRITGEVG